MSDFTHFTSSGRPKLSDVSERGLAGREARATARLKMSQQTLAGIMSGQVFEGDILSMASVGGILGAKQAVNIIPQAHPQLITATTVDFEIDESTSHLVINIHVRGAGPCGMELHAFTGVCAAALTIYDLLKSFDSGICVDYAGVIPEVLASEMPLDMPIIYPPAEEQPAVPRLRVIRQGERLSTAWQLKKPKKAKAKRKTKAKPKSKSGTVRRKAKAKPRAKTKSRAKPRAKAKAKPRAKAKSKR